MYQFMNFCVLMNKSENIDTYVDKIMCTKKKMIKKFGQTHMEFYASTTMDTHFLQKIKERLHKVLGP